MRAILKLKMTYPCRLCPRSPFRTALGPQLVSAVCAMTTRKATGEAGPRADLELEHAEGGRGARQPEARRARGVGERGRRGRLGDEVLGGHCRALVDQEGALAGHAAVNSPQ